MTHPPEQAENRRSGDPAAIAVSAVLAAPGLSLETVITPHDITITITTDDVIVSPPAAAVAPPLVTSSSLVRSPVLLFFFGPPGGVKRRPLSEQRPPPVACSRSPRRLKSRPFPGLLPAWLLWLARWSPAPGVLRFIARAVGASIRRRVVFGARAGVVRAPGAFGGPPMGPLAPPPVGSVPGGIVEPVPGGIGERSSGPVRYPGVVTVPRCPGPGSGVLSFPLRRRDVIRISPPSLFPLRRFAGRPSPSPAQTKNGRPKKTPGGAQMRHLYHIVIHNTARRLNRRKLWIRKPLVSLDKSPLMGYNNNRQRGCFK